GRVEGKGGGVVEVATVGGPSKGGTQIRQFGNEPSVPVALPWTVPQGEDVILTAGEVLRVCGTHRIGQPCKNQLFLGELSDRLQHQVPRPFSGAVCNEQRL